MNIEGVYVPVVMPLTAQQDVDLRTYTRVIEFVLDAGAAGIVANGTTGEYYALSREERVQAMTVARDVTAGRAQLVAGCNAGSTREASTFGATASGLGYDAIMLAAPATALPTQAELAAHFIAVAEASGLPMVLYNYPARMGVEIGVDCLDAIADRPEIVAIKESSGNFSRFLALRSRYAGRIEVMCGSDDQAVDYFFWGVRAWLAGTANVLPREHVDVLNLAIKGDLQGAREAFARLLPFLQSMEGGSYNQKAKLGLTHRGIDCGPVRLPLAPLDEAAAAEFLAVLDAVLA